MNKKFLTLSLLIEVICNLFLVWLVISFFDVIIYNTSPDVECHSWNFFYILSNIISYFR